VFEGNIRANINMSQNNGMDSIKIIIGRLHFEFTMARVKFVMINSDIN